MRTTTRLCLVVAIVAAVGVASVPVADANHRRPGSVNITGTAAHHQDKKQNKKIKKIGNKAENAHDRIARLKSWNFILQGWNSAQQKQIDTILAGVPAIIGGLEALEEGLLAVKAALEGPVAEAFEDIEDALNDSTTGLVGLNLARPQFGIFNPVGTFQGGTGPVNGSDPPFGPEGDATRTGSVFVVDFNNNVLTRVYSVNVFPGTTPANPALPGSAVNCSLAAAVCNSIEAGSGDTSHVLVKIGSGAQAVDGTAFAGFSVTAFSG